MPAPVDAGSAIPSWFKLLLSNRFALVGCIMLLIIVLAAIFAPLLTSYDPSDMADMPSLSPSPDHWFGTNHQGQDIFAQVIYGAASRCSSARRWACSASALAIVVGMVAGYVGGWVDEVLGVVMNIFLVIPQLPLLIVASAYLPIKGGLGMIVILSLTGWAWGARVLRSQTLSLRNRDFVQAALCERRTNLAHRLLRDHAQYDQPDGLQLYLHLHRRHPGRGRRWSSWASATSTRSVGAPCSTGRRQTRRC